ncbi:putative RNA-binding protein [Leishmania major strain Friedlin]|uniref:Putative RNA-binding protein n=1 Tax=Leishmania major TaxID=5664 RepID=Q4Q4J4_LEIMA|nr:putative RNA-binding protein [Leishmania major strain Friedlin]CAG9580578.1 RGG-containing_protein_2_-_putative [Leishmania major strain Friedlin]CAJ05906.1 putative RNA-binding protein [Leishmania major strain Friedlin]|eukprot:XP_001685752.1 putative RNA-binding protein [Leishmania major strain Friedlin]
MLRRSFAPLLTRASAVCLQGWGKTGSGSGWGSAGDSTSAGGWGSAGDSTSAGGWGSAGDSTSAGGWGSAGDSTSAGGWGSAGDSTSAGRWGSAGDSTSAGGWGSAGDSTSAGRWGSAGGRGRGRGSRGKSGWGARDSSDGWGGGRGGGHSGWGGDGGWKDAPTGDRQRGARGSFRRGRGGSGGGVWGQPAAADEDAWNAAPPSFQPPVRRVDPLTLTAVEVEVDGVKKLVGQRVQVSGLSDETTWHTLKDHLRQAGDITFCRLFSGGRGMVEFAVPEDAARCITELQASELEGATLYLREDREDTVLINTRRKIRDARDSQLRARKAEAEKSRREKAIAQGDVTNDSAAAQ